MLTAVALAGSTAMRTSAQASATPRGSSRVLYDLYPVDEGIVIGTAEPKKFAELLVSRVLHASRVVERVVELVMRIECHSRGETRRERPSCAGISFARLPAIFQLVDVGRGRRLLRTTADRADGEYTVHRPTHSSYAL